MGVLWTHKQENSAKVKVRLCARKKIQAVKTNV